MYLKTLELQGFKSFPDKTVIEFDKGMTAIVGANGSGKSNISDAVRWVLGEMSAKSLRGSKMEDVIFNGSAKRKPASFAEVVMTIDNSDFLMKIDFDEVSVGRRLYRSGESEYYLNQKQVRLKDIVDLFLNTGIGREGYSVISQGKIAEIISLKGNERRELFEEAAGISRFRYRKHEATLKLQSVNENAVRINDILSEVQGRLPRLEAQSAKAKAYLAIVGEKKNLELGIWSRRLAGLKQFTEEGKERYAREDKELTLLAQTIEEQDRKIDALYIETQEKNMESELLRGEVTALASSDSELSSTLSVLENEIHHMELKRDEILSMGEKNDTRQKELEQKKIELLEQFACVQEELDGVEQEFSANRAEQNTLALEYTSLVNREEELLSEKDAITAEKSALYLMQKEDQGFRAAGLEQIRELEKKLSEGDGKDEAIRSRLEEVRRHAEQALAEKNESEKKNGEINLELYRLGEEIEDKSEVLQKVRMEKMEAEQRRDTLLRMERLLEGFSDSVKEVMSAAGEELKGICGPVSKLISTQEEYVLAVETALGGGVQNIVVESEQSAKEAIAFLKQNRLGRATFLPLNTLRTGRYDVSSIGEEGFLGIASDLCQSEEKYRPAVEFLLGKTLICRDLESANRLAKREKYSVRIVTLDGQIIHAGGSFTGGQALNLTGVLSRSGDLARLKEEIEKLEARKSDLSEDLSRLEEKRADLRRQAKECEEELNRLRLAAGEAQNALTLEAERMDAAKSAVMQIETEILDIREKIAQREFRAKEIQQKTEEMSLREESISKEVSALRQEKEEKEKAREGLIITQGEILARRGQAQLRLEQEGQKLTDNEEAFRLLQEGEKNKEERLKELAESKEKALERIEEIKQNREALSSSMEEKKKRIALLQERVGQAGEESTRIRQEQKECQAQKEKKMEAFSRLASRLSGAEKEKEGILRSLAEEYELTPDAEEFQSAASLDTEALGGESRLQALRSELRKIGPVNLESVQELEEAQERFRFLNTQYSDIAKSKEELEKLISDLEGTMRDMFTETFEQIRYTFRQIFVELFGGGSADIELTNREDLLNCGVEIKVQPPGKALKIITLLSGGEKAFVAIALYFAILKVRPTPFCLLDEIDAALDDRNVERFANYLRNLSANTQFIVITHRRGTMEASDVLYGVTMQEQGISKLLRLNLNQMEEQLGIVE